MTNTHESFVLAVREVVLRHALLTAEERNHLAATKLVYGIGHNCIRGLTAYGVWNGQSNTMIEIGAAAEEHWVQLAGTTIHELAHALSGAGVGHSKTWKDNCARLGLRIAKAAGQAYSLGYFAPAIRLAIASLPRPEDGTPSFNHAVNLGGLTLTGKGPRPCSAGIGTRGGKSRGPGSGSRLRKFVCSCVPPVILRASRDELNATCNDCGCQFHRD